jgi:hypothetical protein
MLDILRPIPIIDFALRVTLASEIVNSLMPNFCTTVDRQSQSNEPSQRERASEDLVTHSRKSQNQMQEKLVQQIIKKYSEELQSWSPTPPDRNSIHQEEVILLTGASGSIGTVLLDILSTSPRVSKIYALVRGLNNLEKLKKAFIIRGLDCENLFGGVKVEVLNYKMGDVSLGLDRSTYHRLTMEVTTVVHNAWALNFVMGVGEFDADYLRGSRYQSLFGDYLLICHPGTMNLLQFCSIGNAKVFTFMSSGSICMGNGLTVIEVDESRIGDDPAIPLRIGYAQSKYIGKKFSHTWWFLMLMHYSRAFDASCK